MGIECAGYGIRLRWRDEITTGPTAANLEGRGKIKLGKYHFGSLGMSGFNSCQIRKLVQDTA